MTIDRPCRVLFLCTGNSARSILAEAMLQQLGSPVYQAFSAGSAPKDAPHPLALETLAAHGFETTGLASKSWHAFEGDGAPPIDVVLTVCGNAAAETCPIWPGHPVTAHWGVEDPAALDAPRDAQRALFEFIYRQLRAKVEALVAIDPSALDAKDFEKMLRRIGSSVD